MYTHIYIYIYLSYFSKLDLQYIFMYLLISIVHIYIYIYVYGIHKNEFGLTRRNKQKRTCTKESAPASLQSLVGGL